MADLATLVVAVDSTQVPTATKTLYELQTASKETEQATESLTKRQDAFLQSMDRQAATMGRGAAAMRAYKAEQLGLADDKVFNRLNNELQQLESSSNILPRVASRMESMALRSAVHFAVITVAVHGLVTVFGEIIHLQDKWIAFHSKSLEAAANHGLAVSHLVNELHKEAEALASGREPAERAAGAAERMAVLKAQLMAQGPQYREALSKENMSLQEILETTEKINLANIKALESQIALAEKKPVNIGFLKMAQGVALNFAGSFLSPGLLNSLGAVATAPDYEEAALKKQTEINKLLEARAKLLKGNAEIHGAYDKPEKKEALDTSENRFQAELNRLKAEELQYTLATTIAEKEKKEMAKLYLTYEEQQARYEKERKDSIHNGVSPAIANARFKNLTERSQEVFDAARLEIMRKSTDEMVKLQLDRDNRLEQLEGTSFEKRMAKERQFFEAKNAQYAKEGIATIPRAAFEDYQALERMKEIETQASKLRSEMHKLATEKGRALTFDEEIEAAGKLGERLHLLPGAIVKYREELQRLKDRSQDMWGGMKAGLVEFGIKAGDVFSQMKSMSENWANSTANAFADLAMTGKANFRSLINSMLADLARLAAQQAMLDLFKSFYSGGGGGTMASAGSAAGSAIGAAVSSYGGLASGNSGAAPSIYVPPGSASAQPAAAPVSVNVNVAANGGVSTQGDMGANAKALGVLVGAKVREVLVNEQRPGGLLMASR